MNSYPKLKSIMEPILTQLEAVADVNELDSVVVVLLKGTNPIYYYISKCSEAPQVDFIRCDSSISWKAL